MSKTEFLKKFNISLADFDKTGLKYQDLIDIKVDYGNKFQMFDDAGANLVRILLRFDDVHSVKYRVKDGEHLMAKIIRKKLARPKIQIDSTNYQTLIQDLIGIRILHLFKSDWLTIHGKLMANFKTIQKPEANIRRGDDETHLKESGCKIKVHKDGYRSVHYIIKTEPTLKTLIAEIQVRTILEEAWGEIDHKIRYPHNMDNPLINQYLQIFNRAAGSADEMGDYVLYLNNEMRAKEIEIESLKTDLLKFEDNLDKSEIGEKAKDNLTTSFKSIQETLDQVFNSRVRAIEESALNAIAFKRSRLLIDKGKGR